MEGKLKVGGLDWQVRQVVECALKIGEQYCKESYWFYKRMDKDHQHWDFFQRVLKELTIEMKARGWI